MGGFEYGSHRQELLVVIDVSFEDARNLTLVLGRVVLTTTVRAPAVGDTLKIAIVGAKYCPRTVPSIARSIHSPATVSCLLPARKNNDIPTNYTLENMHIRLRKYCSYYLCHYQHIVCLDHRNHNVHLCQRLIK